MAHSSSSSPSPLSGRRFTDGSASPGSLLADGTTLVGAVEGISSLEVCGIITGPCKLEGLVLVKPTGKVTGTIIAADVVVTGEVVGDIQATRKIELGPASKVIGDITAPSIAIEEGCYFEGNITMSGERQRREMITFKERRTNHQD